MRKLLFVLLFALLVAFTGCQSGKLPDAAVSSSPPRSDSSDTVPADTAHGSSTEASEASDPSSQTEVLLPEASDPPVGSSSSETRKPVSSTPAESSNPKPAQPPSNSSGSSWPTTSVPPPAESAPPAPPTSTTDPPAESAPTQPSQPEPDMEAEYARIIRETVAYAESYAEKGFTFIWDDSLEFSWESGAGWMGTPRVKYEGIDGTIEMLQYHIDKIVKIAGGPGVPGYSAYYKVMQVVVDGDIAFVVLYG